MKKILSVALIFTSMSLSAFSVFADSKYDFKEKKAIKDSVTKEFNTDISAIDLVKEMDIGWNLGNTLDANGSKSLSSETSWGQPKTTKEMIDAIAKSGIKTIRIPTSWANHLDKDFTIDPKWMKRVKQVVDWAIEDGLYVILNDHHDNLMDNKSKDYGYYPDSLSFNKSRKFIKNVWAQIALAFNSGYYEHLVFEFLNEPRLRGHNHEWGYDKKCNICIDAATNLNKLNQLALDTIRESGSNNTKRFVMVTGLAAAFESYERDDSFKLPNDSSENKMILSIHLYKPYTFAMENSEKTIFEENYKSELSYYFKWLDENYVQKSVPIVIGEYGATNKNNLEERVKWFNFFLKESGKYGMCAILWDNGDADARYTYEEKFGFFNRKDKTWYFPEIINAITTARK